jgi:hypothetical protein
MNGCGQTQARFTEYLDGRMTGIEMQQVAAHLEGCAYCAGEWASLRQLQASLASLPPVKTPSDLVLKIRVGLSRERAHRRKSYFQTAGLAWKNTLGPFLLQAAAGFASAVLLLGTVSALVTMFAQPERAVAQLKDEPLGNATAPHFRFYLNGSEHNEIVDTPGPVVVEAYINGAGRVYDYRIVSGPTDGATRSQVETLLDDSVFEPARFFGQPVKGLAILSFSGVSVRG